MKNREATIEQFEYTGKAFADVNGKFYVLCRPIGQSTQYLHSDGKWRPSTINEDDGYTGYFDSREAAEKALAENRAKP